MGPVGLAPHSARGIQGVYIPFNFLTYNELSRFDAVTRSMAIVTVLKFSLDGSLNGR